MADFLDATLTQIQELRHAETPGTYIRQRLAVSAEQLSNKARIAAEVEKANEAIAKLAFILYDTVDKFPVNIDSTTFRLLIPTPWGDSGYAKWGLRATEARILRAILMKRLNDNSKLSLFDYSNRQWFLNAQSYAGRQKALNYVKENPITISEWLILKNALGTQKLRKQSKTSTK